MAEQRAAVQFFVAGGLSVQRACALVQIHRSTFRYVAHPTDDTALLSQIQALAVQHPRYGYRRISVLINRTQYINQKRVRRLWQLHRLQVRRLLCKRTRRVRPDLMATRPRALSQRRRSLQRHPHRKPKTARRQAGARCHSSWRRMLLVLRRIGLCCLCRTPRTPTRECDQERREGDR